MDYNSPILRDLRAVRAAVAHTSRRDTIRYLTENSPKVRTRTDGPVGPELDYSFWFSRVYHDEYGKFSKFATWYLKTDVIDPFREWSVANPGLGRACLHHNIETLGVSESGIAAWTEFAMKRNIRFKGDYGYYMPAAKKIPLLKKADFQAAKARGDVPHSVRSQKSAIRRASVRRSRRCDPVRMASRALPLEIQWPVRVTPDPPASRWRKDWRKRPDCTFSQYRITHPRVEVFTLSGVNPKYRLPLSRPVCEAIAKIYSTELRVKAFVPNVVVKQPQGFRWRVPEPEMTTSSPMITRPVLNRRAKIVPGLPGQVVISTFGGVATTADQHMLDYFKSLT